MVSSNAKGVDEYIASLSTDRQKEIKLIRGIILRNLPKGYKEGMQYGMIGYFIPLEDYPNTYNGQPLAIAGLAAQKNYTPIFNGCLRES